LAITVGASTAAIVELRCETDFVTRSALFGQLSNSLAATMAAGDFEKTGDANGDPLLGAPLMLGPGVTEQQLMDRKGVAVGAALLELSSVLGERLVLGKNWCLAPTASASNCPVALAGYAHPKFADGLPGTGRMAAIVAIGATCQTMSSEVQTRLDTICAQLARHIVAAQPRFTSVDTIPADVLEKEKSTIRSAHLAQMDPKKAAKIDENVLQKVIDGKTNKFYQDNVLLKQDIILPQVEGNISVERWLHQEADALGVERLVVQDFCFASL